MTDYVIEQKTHVLMERPEPTFYAKIPKMAQMDLDPYELALYSNYKQTASDNPNGGVWKSNETLAKECRMSPRKITQVRQALVEKGFIHCQYETSESGKEFSAAIVTIVDVWMENHKRFSKEGIAPDANPPSHDVLTPLAPRANKEESFNKNKDSKKELPPTPVTGDEPPTAFDVMKTAAKRLLKQYDNRTLDPIVKTLLCQHTGKNADKNLIRPITVSELEAFCAWWDKKKDREGNPLTRPANQKSVLNRVSEWLETVNAPKAAPAETPILKAPIKLSAEDERIRQQNEIALREKRAEWDAFNARLKAEQAERGD